MDSFTSMMAAMLPASETAQAEVGAGDTAFKELIHPPTRSAHRSGSSSWAR